MEHRNPSQDQLSVEVLDRYLAGSASADERAQVDEWLAAKPSRRIGELFARHEAGGAQAALHRVLHGATQPERAAWTVHATRSDVVPRWTHLSSLGRDSLRTAAIWLSSALVILLVIGFALPHRAERSPASQVYQTPAGRTAAIRLADGTTIILAPATSVMMTKGEMTVAGEAYFSVTPHRESPFVVRTKDALVQVLGTRFSVRQYPEDRGSRVVVEDGRVALHRIVGRRGRSDEEKQMVLPARTVAFVTDSSITVTPGIVIRDYTSWTKGTLVFNQVPLSEVLTELSRAYGADIRVTDTVLARQPMQLDVAVDHEALLTVLNAICEVSNAHLVRGDRTYLLSPGRKGHGSLPTAPVRPQLPQPEYQYGR